MKQTIERRAPDGTNWFLSMPYVTGPMSIFAGPDDREMTETEGLALMRFCPGRARDLGTLKFPLAELARRPCYYVALRLPLDRSEQARDDPQHLWRGVKFQVQNPETRKAVIVLLVDWGPSADGIFDIDVSPDAATAIGADTGDDLQFGFPDSQDVSLGPCEYEEWETD